MDYVDFPDRWKRQLSLWLAKYGHQEEHELSSMDFSLACPVRMRFDDESEARFTSAIVIEAPELNEIGIFTEFHGYHIFPLGKTHVAREEY